MVIGIAVLAVGHLWLACAPTGSVYQVAVLTGLLVVATGVALSFTPTTMVIASAVPETHTGLAAGLAGSATQVGAALSTATFTAIGLAVGTPSGGCDRSGPPGAPVLVSRCRRPGGPSPEAGRGAARRGRPPSDRMDGLATRWNR